MLVKHVFNWPKKHLVNYFRHLLNEQSEPKAPELLSDLNYLQLSSGCGADWQRTWEERQWLTMKTQRRVCVLWSLFTIVLLCFKADTYETPITRHRRPSLKVGPPKPKLLKLSTVIYSPTVEEESGSPAVSPFRTRNFSPSSSTRPIDIQSDSVAAQSDVSVTCSTAHFVLRVKPGFYGLDADVEELTLGGGCRSNGVLRPYGDILFNYPLTACDAIREVRCLYMLYLQYIVCDKVKVSFLLIVRKNLETQP